MYRIDKSKFNSCHCSSLALAIQDYKLKVVQNTSVKRDRMMIKMSPIFAHLL